MTDAGLRIVCALAPEAKPLIRAFTLSALPSSNPFRIYRHPSDDVWLVISGVGKAAAAAAVAHLAAVSDVGPAHGWVNVGICGHHQAPVGTPLRAHKVLDAGSGKSWYPTLLDRCLCETDTVRTVDKPDAQYAVPGMVDMEASGFYESALRYTSQELVQVIKVVSDNPHRPVVRFQSKEVVRLIEEAYDAIEALIMGVGNLSKAEGERLADPPGFHAFQDRWRFSASQQVQLRKLLGAWVALRGEAAEPSQYSAHGTSRDVIRQLTARLEASRVSWDAS